MEQAPVNENPIKELRLRSSYNAETSTQKYNNLTQNNSIANEIEETAVGSFLDSFKDDPLMKTIYFTSRDLTFSYQKKIANLFQLGFDMEPSEYEKYMASLYENSEEPKIEYSDQEKNIMKEEASNLFRLISEYFSTILYFLAGMIGALYLFIRYILIKYI
ncbi:MAG: hypothetical protein K9G26_10695 [Emcibacter sp.]|nr:hypothetical protein [Emcibacter sp.]